MFGKRKILAEDERKIYVKEIKRLSKQVNEWMAKYEIANSQKAEYEKLKKEYAEKAKEMDELIKNTKRLAKQHEDFLDTVRNNNKNK